MSHRARRTGLGRRSLNTAPPPLLDPRFAVGWLLWAAAGAAIPVLMGRWHWPLMVGGWGLLGFAVECLALRFGWPGATFSELWWYARSQGGWGKWFAWQAGGFLLVLALWVMRPELISWEFLGRAMVATLCVWFAAHVASRGKVA